MNNKQNLLLAFFLWIASTQMYSQTYYLSVTQEPYASLGTGFPLTEGVWDDPTYTVPIGFDFELFDQMISNLESSDALLGGSLGVDFSGTTTSVLHVFGPDLIDRGFQTGTSMSTIYFRTDGSAGQRVFTQEWDNVGFFNGEVENNVYKDFVNFQLKLYEESGDIAFHFGPASITNEFQDYGGAGGPSLGLLKELDLQGALVAEEVILLSGSPSNPTIITEFVETYLNGSIPENTVYRFSKTPSSAHDIVVTLTHPFLLPNPTSGDLHLNTQLSDDVIFPIRIYNMNGQLVKTVTDVSSLHVQDLVSGLYEARFLSSAGPAGQRIVLR